jgi:hypothetical protein
MSLKEYRPLQAKSPWIQTSLQRTNQVQRMGYSGGLLAHITYAYYTRTESKINDVHPIHPLNIIAKRRVGTTAHYKLWPSPGGTSPFFLNFGTKKHSG